MWRDKYQSFQMKDTKCNFTEDNESTLILHERNRHLVFIVSADDLATDVAKLSASNLITNIYAWRLKKAGILELDTVITVNYLLVTHKSQLINIYELSFVSSMSYLFRISVSIAMLKNNVLMHVSQ